MKLRRNWSCFVVVILVLLVTPAYSLPLISTFSSSLQGNVKIKVCGCAFKQYFAAPPGSPSTGFESAAKVETSFRNVIDMMNDQLEANLTFVWDGFLDDFASSGGDGIYCNSIPNICTNDAYYGSPGYIVVKALPLLGPGANTDCIPDDWYGICPGGVGCGTEECVVRFFDQMEGGIDYPLALSDAATGGQLQSVLLHEVLHDVGFLNLNQPGGNQPNNEPFSVMNQIGRFPWHEDSSRVTEVPVEDPGFTSYAHRQGQRIRHLVSPNGGANWYYGTDAGLTQYSNDHVDLAINSGPSPAQLVLAWTRDTFPKRVFTMRGVATSSYTVTWDSQTLVDHGNLAESWYGPSIAYGNGEWVLVWADKGINDDTTGVDGRNIYYAYSFDGVSWTDPVLLQWTCSGCWSTEYGALGTPVVRYNASQQKFIVLWSNWQSATAIPIPFDMQGRLRQCSLTPGLLTVVSKCNELQTYDGNPVVPWHTASMSCHSSYNSCLITKTPDDGDGDNFFQTNIATLLADGRVSLSTPPAPQLGWSTRNELSGAYGNGSHYIASRGQDGNHWLNVGRYDSALPGWTDKRVVGVTMRTGPALVVGPGDDIRVYYLAP